MMTKKNKYHSVLIDLDETLYPKSNGVWSAISSRINQFIVQCLQVSPDEAIRIRQNYLRQFGTTLMGLRTDYDIDPFEYLEFVHDIPIENLLLADPDLQIMLERISAKKIIFTNASAAHANRILQHLEITDLIDQVIDIVALEFINKPHPEAYKKAMRLGKIGETESCVMVDDRIENLIPAHELSMTTVLVGSDESAKGIDFSLTSITGLLDAIPELAN